MNNITQLTLQALNRLDASGPWLAFVLLRLLIGWEFLESGLMKYHGENWFSHIQGQFLFPFNVIAVEVSWFMATWFEIVGGIALMLGIGTRFFAVSLIVLTIVAAAAVHLPTELIQLSDLFKGYAITDKGFGNFKLPLLFIAMLLPLLFMGPGRMSVDAFFRSRAQQLVINKGNQ